MRLMYGPLSEDRLEAEAIKGKVFGQIADKWMVTKFSKDVNSQSFVEQADFYKTIEKQNRVDGRKNKYALLAYAALHYPDLVNNVPPYESL